MSGFTFKVRGAERLDGVVKNIEKQARYAASKGLNQTATDVQDALRHHVRDVLTIRAGPWADRNVKRRPSDFATRESLTARVRMEAPGGSDKPSIFVPFEFGTPKIARDPSMPIAIPSENIRSSPADLVPRKLYPTSLRLMPRRTPNGVLAPRTRTTRGGGVVMVGKMRTFVIDNRQGFGRQSWGVFQRTGQHDVELLWTYKLRVARPKRLDFYGVATRVAGQRIEMNMAKAINDTIRTAR